MWYPVREVISMSELTLRLGKRIKQLRVMRDMTQEELAEASNVSISFLGNVERGSKNPTVETIYKIANALDVTMSELLSFDTGMQVLEEPTSVELRRLLSEYSDKIQNLYKK